MSNRIRYSKTKDENIKVSKRNFVSEKSGVVYKVSIDIEKKTYRIKNIATENSIIGGDNINNINVLKRKVKQHLIELGVNFEAESRNRTFGICEQGYTQDKHEKN